MEVFISMVEKGVFGLVLIKKRHYWPEGVSAEEIIWHTQNEEVGDRDAVKGSIRGEIYDIMAIKDPNYVVLMMTKYGTLEHLEE